MIILIKSINIFQQKIKLVGISTVNLIGLQQNEKNVLSIIKDNISLKECFERNLSC